MIRLQGLHKYFNKGRSNEIHVLNDITLDFPETGLVAIFGKSGCGKTTLLNVIGGLDGFRSGTLTLNGQSITENTDDLRNRYVGYIFQNYNLNKGESCFDNVADALRLCGLEDTEILESRVMAALRNVGMENYRSRTPDTLSGGQQQRIAIARAIVKNPRIILADEPTGNLDEANTLHIMNLLREIARERLVLLVTHEANLVDHYCDTVIELKDGSVVSVRENTNVSGYTARNKNHIYLGELEQVTQTAANTEIEYFGEAPDRPIRLRVINSGGRLYLKLCDERVQVLDGNSEVRLLEGVFHAETATPTDDTKVDMSQLPPLESRRCGRLFSLPFSIKSGYLSNFRHRKKGKKLLMTCMTLFAAIFVLMTSIFGTAFASVEAIEGTYNHNVFYVYTPDGSVSERLFSALGKEESGVDYLRLFGSSIPGGDASLQFLTGVFESFTGGASSSRLRANAALLDASLISNAPLLAGKKEINEPKDLIITSTVADALLSTSTFDYISRYEDLIGLISPYLTVNGTSVQIVGIVESNETAAYLSAEAMARYVLGQLGLQVRSDTDYERKVENGKTVLIGSANAQGLPKIGSTVKIHGTPFTVSEVRIAYSDYESFLKANGKSADWEDPFEAWCREQIKLSHPHLEEASTEWTTAMEELGNRSYFQWLIEVYYADLHAYLQSYDLLNGELGSWLYLEKDIEDLKYLYMQADKDLYRAYRFREVNGAYPTLAEREAGVLTAYPDLEEVAQSYYAIYENEYYSANRGNRYSQLYIVSNADYIALSKQTGETHATASAYGGEFHYGKQEIYAKGADIMVETIVSPSGNPRYTLLHSKDPERTEAWLRESFSDIESPFIQAPALLCPSDIHAEQMSDNRADITVSLITLGILLAVMSVCMYFIMRSSLMNRIKEVGIYRAIGVSRKNLVFRFFVESLVLTTLTVFPGYLAVSTAVSAWLTSSPLLSELFFYPLWVALAVLALLYGICLFCGTVPILSLLRKTPSEILAQYDI